MVWAMVALGGALGAVLRFAAVQGAARWLGPEFPYGVMLVNVGGSFAMGLLAVIAADKAPDSMARWAPFVLTGVLGGFTTFSAFSVDALGLLERARYTAAAAYMGGTVMLSLLAALAGATLGRQL